MTRLLLAGTGLIGCRHLEHIQEHPDLSLAGIIDPVTEHWVKGVPGFTEVGAVDVDADGIVIATPTETHAPLARQAAERGWHVLVEKPLAESLTAADEIIAAAARAGVQILVGHHRRHHPVVAKMKEIVDSGRLGRPVLASLIWAMRKEHSYFEADWRAGMSGAPVKQNLIHDVDVLRYLFGEITDVVGLGSNAVRGAARTESGGAVLAFASGMTATLAFADTTPTPWGFEAGTGENPNIATTGEDSLRIAFTQGAVDFPSLRVWTGSETWAEAPSPSETMVTDGVPLIRQLEHFAEVIAGRATPIIDGHEGRKTLDATLQIEAATLPAGVA